MNTISKGLKGRQREDERLATKQQKQLFVFNLRRWASIIEKAECCIVKDKRFPPSAKAITTIAQTEIFMSGELAVITKTYDVISWSCQHVIRFPRQLFDFEDTQPISTDL